MAISFSDLFTSGKNNSATQGDAGADTEVSSDGVTIAAESYSRNEDGSESYDRTSVDTGRSDLAGGLDGDSASSGETEAASSSADAENGSSGNQSRADQTGDAYGEASNEGFTMERESYSRDEDGSETHDSTRADTGASEIAIDLDVDSMSDAMSGLSSTAEDEGAFI